MEHPSPHNKHCIGQDPSPEFFEFAQEFKNFVHVREYTPDRLLLKNCTIIQADTWHVPSLCSFRVPMREFRRILWRKTE